MKFPAIAMAVCLLASCSKKDMIATPAEPGNEPVSCKFGVTEFNLGKRGPVEDGLEGRGKPPRNNWSFVPPTTSNPAVILLDFDGEVVQNTAWNVSAPINCAPANMSSENLQAIFNRIANDYSAFNVVVTTNETTYQNAPSNRRVRLIFTETWEWFGQAGGAAFLNSFGTTSNPPAFVFTSLLNYNPKAIAEAGAHELGHTFGLEHQSSYDGSALINFYNYGTGSGEVGWAPIMGCGYYKNLTLWHNGPTSNGYNQMQDEVAMLNNKIGTISDDVSGTITGAEPLTSTREAVIHHSNDVDAFYMNLSSTKTFRAVPYNVGTGNNGANLDIVLKVYTAAGQLLQTINDPSVLDASVTLSPGQYVVSVSVDDNVNISRYGMVGKYTVSLN